MANVDLCRVAALRPRIVQPGVSPGYELALAGGAQQGPGPTAASLSLKTIALDPVILETPLSVVECSHVQAPSGPVAVGDHGVLEKNVSCDLERDRLAGSCREPSSDGAAVLTLHHIVPKRVVADLGGGVVPGEKVQSPATGAVIRRAGFICHEMTIRDHEVGILTRRELEGCTGHTASPRDIALEETPVNQEGGLVVQVGVDCGSESVYRGSVVESTFVVEETTIDNLDPRTPGGHERQSGC